MLPPDSPAEPTNALKQWIVGICITLGLICMALGFAWFMVMPTSWFITPEDADKNTQIAMDFHKSTGQAGSAKELKRPNAKELEAKRAYTEQQYEAVKAERDFWTAVYHRSPMWLKIAAGVFFGIGLMIHLNNRPKVRN